jgi:uncharacterized protein
VIQVNPYEVLRLARGLGLSTGDFIDRFVDADRVALRRSAVGTCVFLGDSGCTVHADRPLVCRLYPLGRIVRAGRERWVELPAADGSIGERDTGGSVAEYVASQGALPFMLAADEYHGVLEEALLAGGSGFVSEPAGAGPDGSGDSAAEGARWLLDVDALVDSGGDVERDFVAHVGALRSVLVG